MVTNELGLRFVYINIDGSASPLYMVLLDYNMHTFEYLFTPYAIIFILRVICVHCPRHPNILIYGSIGLYYVYTQVLIPGKL